MSGWSGEHQGENEVRDDLVEVDGELYFFLSVEVFFAVEVDVEVFSYA